MRSEVRAGKVVAEVDLPHRNQPKRLQLRARVPDGFKIVGATIRNKKLEVDDAGTVDLTGLSGKGEVVFTVR
jgi:hypothetical protein